MSDQEIKQKKVLSIRQIEAKRKGGIAKAKKMLEIKQKSEQTEQDLSISEQVEQESEQDKLYRYIEHLNHRYNHKKKEIVV